MSIKPSSKWEAAFNRWMDDFTNDPEAYERVESIAIRHLRQKLQGAEPTYGQEAAAVFAEYLGAV